MPTGPFRLNPVLDPAALRSRFERTGRVRVEDFVAGNAAKGLADALVADQRWMLVINGSDTVFEIPRAAYEAMDPAERTRIEDAVHAAAAHGFQFRYETIRVPDARADRRRSGTMLDDFARFMSATDTLAFLAEVTGASDLAFADAQATRYKSGDFLTRHDDNVAGKDRRLAYVLGLTNEWRAEWGGLLLFNDGEGDVIETMVPRYNTLTLFAVPQPHSVSYVAPTAPHPRLSVTGWIRSRVPKNGP